MIFKTSVKKISFLPALAISIFLATFLLTSLFAGASFTANNVADDSLFDDVNSMSASSIDAFLNNNFPNSCISTNKGFTAPNPTGYSPSTGYTYGSSVSAGTVIYNAAQAYGLNPRVLVATLEKESSLVSGSGGCASWRYISAMGNGCPDSGGSYSYSGFEMYSINGTPVTSASGTCVNSASKAGFSRQVITGTWLMKFDQQHAIGNYNWAVIKPGWDNSDDLEICYSGPMTQGYYKRGNPSGCNSTIFYDGYTTIDGTSVHMDTGATAALYHYTPHFHGNELFVNIYESWFGPTNGQGFVVATSYLDNGDPRQWVVYHGQKHLIPDTAIKQAWGLQNATLLQWDGEYLGSHATSSDLTRLLRPSGSLNIYLVADGKKYRLPNTQMLDIWNLSIGNLVDVSASLGALPTDTGELGYLAQLSGSPAVYLMDSGVKRHILDGNILNAFGSDAPHISVFTGVNDTYFSNLTSGADIGTPKISDGNGHTYILDSGRKLILDSVMNQLYPGESNSVTPAIYNYFGTQQMTYIIRAWNSPDVYLIDNSQKHHIIDPDVLDAWQSATYPSSVTTTSMGLRDFITDGTSITDYYASAGSNKYLIDKWSYKIGSSLQSAYTSSRTVYSASDALIGVFPASSSPTGLVKSSSSPAVYLLTNNGVLRHLTSPQRLSLWAGSQAITTLKQSNLNRYASGGGIGVFVNDGTNNYLIEGGYKHPIDAATKSNWGLGTAEPLTDGTLSRVATGSAIVNELQDSGVYFLIHQGGAFATTDWNIADMWGLTDAPAQNSAVLREYLPTQMLTRIAKSRIDSRLFIVNKGNLYRLYPNTAANLDASGPLTWVDPSSFPVFDWTAVVVKDEAGNNYVIDGGAKRPLPAGVIRDQWTFGNQADVPVMGNGFLNTLPTSRQIERAIKGSGPNIYSGENFTKRWVQNPNTYSSSYAPYTGVNNSLLDSMPDGDPVP